MILPALTAGVFDPVPLERMPEAERAVRTAGSQVPSAIRQRLVSGGSLTSQEREVLLGISQNAVAGFYEPR